MCVQLSPVCLCVRAWAQTIIPRDTWNSLFFDVFVFACTGGRGCECVNASGGVCLLSQWDCETLFVLNSGDHLTHCPLCLRGWEVWRPIVLDGWGRDGPQVEWPLARKPCWRANLLNNKGICYMGQWVGVSQTDKGGLLCHTTSLTSIRVP